MPLRAKYYSSELARSLSAMRITGGSLCGRMIKVPRGLETRPTQDRVRESIFAILGDRLEDAAVLDAFAGSGSLGIEAISRGASSCVFVEKSKRAAKVAADNIIALGIGGRCRTIVADAVKGCSLWLVGKPYKVVFVDPPYMSGVHGDILRLIASEEALCPLGVVVVEREKGVSLEPSYGKLQLRRSERYGATVVDFYQLEAEV